MFLGPGYIMTNQGVSISTAITAIQYAAGANGPAEVERFGFSQSTSTTTNAVRAALLRKTAGATVTTGVAGTTLLKQNPVNPTSNATLGTSSTGITATAEGTNGEVTDPRGLNVLNGLEVLYAPEERPLMAQGAIMACTFMSAPPSATWDVFMRVRELRGS